MSQTGTWMVVSKISRAMHCKSIYFGLYSQAAYRTSSDNYSL